MIYNIFFIILLGIAAWCAWRISVADWRRRIIPDVYLFPLLLIGLIIINFFPWPVSMGDAVLAATFGYALALIIGIIFDKVHSTHTPDAIPIGMGDIKLLATGGIWLGSSGLAMALVIACIVGILWGKINHQKYIPLAPFFICGGFLAFIINSFLI